MIDEKGKLFGKINIVDLLVILAIIVIAVMVGLKLKSGGGLFSKAPEGGTIHYTVLVRGVRPEVFASIQAYPNDTLMASGVVISGSKVLSVTSAPHVANATITTRDGALVVPLDEDLLDLTFSIEAKVADKIINEVGTQEVRIGKTHTVKTVHYELSDGVITACGWDPAEK